MILEKYKGRDMKVRNPTYSGTKKNDKINQRRVSRRISKHNLKKEEG